jgi:hypothetical protein
MPEIDAAAIKKIIEMILDLKAKQEVAEKRLETLGVDLESLRDEQLELLAELRHGLPKAAWMNSHASQVQSLDFQQLLQALKSRR